MSSVSSRSASRCRSRSHSGSMALAIRTAARLAFVEHRRCGAPIAPVSPAGSLDGEAREPGMQGQPGACAAEVRGLTARIERTDAAQQLLRELERGRRRRIEPWKGLRLEPAGAKLQHRTREIQALDLGRMMLGPRVEVVPGVQA